MKSEIEKIKELFLKRNFYFSINENGNPTISCYGVNGKHPEIFVETRPNPELTVVHIEGMSEHHPHILSTLKFLIDNDSKLENARLRFDNNEEIKIKEFIENQGKNIKNKTDLLPEYLYHGTSTYFWEQISENGLMCREMTGNEPQYKSIFGEEGLKDRVYFCTEMNIGSAKYSAIKASENTSSDEIILKIKTANLDRKLLEPDEDSNCFNWQESLQKLGTLAYRGIIHPSEIEVHVIKRKNKPKIK